MMRLTPLRNTLWGAILDLSLIFTTLPKLLSLAWALWAGVVEW